MNKQPPLPPGLEEALRQRFGDMQAAGGMPTRTPDAKSVARAQHNPIPEGPDGMRIMRSLADCPMPAAAKELNSMLQELINLDTDSIKEEEIEKLLATGVATAFRSNAYCKENSQTRVVCDMNKSEELKHMTDRLRGMEKAALKLQEDLQAKVMEINELMEERWEYAKKHHGLDISKTSYRILDNNSTIESVTLDCDSCAGSKAVLDIKEKIANLLLAEEEKQND